MTKATEKAKAKSRPDRSSAEWITFGVAMFILLGVVGLIIAEAATTHTPPQPVATRAAPDRRDGGRFFVPVEVRNHGDKTAAAVQVVARITVGGREHQADQLIDFLAGGESAHVEFVFEEDPSAGAFSVGVASFQEP